MMSRTFSLEEAFNLSMLMRRMRVYGYLKAGYDLDKIAEIEEVSTNFLRKYVLFVKKL